MEEQVIINKTDKPDSIEWRLDTGKSIKVYGNADNPIEFKQNIQNCIKILKEINKENE